MKRKKERIILSAAVTLCMTCTALPIIAHAEEDETAIECTHVHDENCGYVEGDEESCQHVHDESCMVKKDDESTENNEDNESDSSEIALLNENTRSVSTDLNSGSVVFDQDGTYTIANVNATSNTITVKKGTTVNLTIQNVNITAQDAPAILVEAGATLNLTVEGTNTLKVDNRYAAISVEPGYDADNDFDLSASAVLNISGSGTLTTQGGDGDPSNSAYGGGAGIGGDGQQTQNIDVSKKQVDFGKIHITSNFSGIINTTGGLASTGLSNYADGGGAGIGSGGFNMGMAEWDETYGQIIIDAGTINANPGSNEKDIGSGIGSGGVDGYGTGISYITTEINGGTINAQGGLYSAGIGGGSMCTGGYITINNGKITAKSGGTKDAAGAAGIGGGNNESCKEIIISGGTVLAQATAGGGAGIGGGTTMTDSNVHYGDKDGAISEERVGKITISGANTKVIAYGGTGHSDSGEYRGGAGIGAGYPGGSDNKSVALDITIKNQATVSAYSGYHAQSIGYGYRASGATGYGITLTLDDTINLWAMNKDCYQPALVKKAQYDKTTGYVQYSSKNNKYLMEYLDSNVDATATTTGKANAYLERSLTVNDPSSVDWSFAGKKMTVKNTDGKSVALDTPFDTLSGNWAIIGQFEGKTQPSTEPPVIDFASAFLSGGSLILTVNDTFEPLKYVTAKDSEGNDISSDIKVVDNNVDMTKAGTYKVTYRVTDKNGNSVEKTLTVVVKAKDNTNNETNVKVKYDLGNGQGDIEETVKEGSSITLKEAPTKEGYTFKGWSDGSKTYQPKETVTVSKDTTFTAVWEKIDNGNSSNGNNNGENKDNTGNSDDGNKGNGNVDNNGNGNNEKPSTGTKEEPKTGVKGNTTSTPEVKKASGSKKTKTGDESRPMIYVELGLMAIIGCVIIFLQNKKSQLLNK